MGLIPEEIPAVGGECRSHLRRKGDGFCFEKIKWKLAVEKSNK